MRALQSLGAGTGDGAGGYARRMSVATVSISALA